MSASGTHVDVNDACATRLLSRGRVECGRVESNHHSHWRRGYSALSSPVLGVRKDGSGRSDSNRQRGSDPVLGPAGDPGSPTPLLLKIIAAGRARTDTAGITTPDACRYITAAKREMEGGIGSPQPGAETLPSDGPGASCCTSRQSCQRHCDAATPSPVGPGGLSAQLHVRARALRSPVPSLPRPARRRVDPSKWRGWDSNPRSRAHEAREDSRSSTARRSLERERRSGRQDSNLRSPTPEVGGVARSPLRPVGAHRPPRLPRQGSNLRHEG